MGLLTRFRSFFVFVLVSSVIAACGGDDDPDTTPDAFSFTAQTNVARDTSITSNSITVADIERDVAISIAGGTYSVGGGAPTDAAGTVSEGDQVAVQVTSSSDFSTAASATLTIAGVAGTFSVTTLAQDIVPDAFSFVDQTDVALNAVITSTPITIAGINDATAISISGGTYSFGGGAATDAAGTVSEGDEVTVQVTSSSDFSTAASATLTVGGVAGTFSVTTLAQDIVPNAFSFADQAGVALNTLITSAPITITGINDATAISVSAEAAYRIDGAGAFVGTAGTINNDQTVEVQVTAAATNSSVVEATLTVGGVSDTFTVTTEAETVPPTATIEFPPPVSMTEGAAVTVRGTAEDALSDVVAVRVNGELATDTSGDGSFATWRISADLADGDNTLSVEVEDSLGNIDSSAASVMVRRDALTGDFPDSNNPLSLPRSIAIDYERNRLIIGDQELLTLITVDMATGARTQFSDNSGVILSINFAEGLLVDEANDRVLFLNSVDEFIYDIDLETSIRTVLTSNEDPVGAPEWNFPQELIYHPTKQNTLLVFDIDAITEVNLLDGARTTFSSAGEGDHEPTPDLVNDFAIVRGGVYHEASASILTVDTERAVPRIVSASLSNGARTIFSDATTPNSDAPLFNDPRTVAMDAARDRILVNDAGFGGIIEVGLSGLAEGVRTVFSDATTPDTLNAPVEPEEIFYDGVLGYALLLDTALDAVLAIDIESGERVIYSRGDTVE